MRGSRAVVSAVKRMTVEQGPFGRNRRQAELEGSSEHPKLSSAWGFKAEGREHSRMLLSCQAIEPRTSRTQRVFEALSFTEAVQRSILG